MQHDKIVLKNFFLNLLFLTLIFLAVGIPVVTWINFIVVCFATVIVITGNLSLDLKKLIMLIINS